MIQVFAVVPQVALLSILGVFERFGATNQFIPNYIYNYCLNFLMALPAQLFISGPIARALFRKLLRRVNGSNEDKKEAEMREHGIAE